MNVLDNILQNQDDLYNIFNDYLTSFNNVEPKYTVTEPVQSKLERNDWSNPFSDAQLRIRPDQTSFFPDFQIPQQQQSFNQISSSQTTNFATQKPGKVSKSTTDFFEEVEPMIRRSVDKHSIELGIRDQNQKELVIKCIAAQMALETNRGTSSLWKNYNNPGGLTYTATASKYGGRKGNKQPDGNSNYIYFNNRADAVEMMVNEFYNKMGRYKGILAQSKSVSDFVTRIKKAGYFGGNLNDYIRNCESFAKQYDNWKQNKKI